MLKSKLYASCEVLVAGFARKEIPASGFGGVVSIVQRQTEETNVLVMHQARERHSTGTMEQVNGCPQPVYGSRPSPVT